METTRPFGFNVIGYVSGNLGIGVAARNLVELIIENGFPVAIYDMNPGGGRGGYDGRFDRFCVERVENLPYAANLFVLPPPALGAIVQDHWMSISKGDCLNAALVFWELPVLPASWIPAHDAMDVIVAVSESIRCMFQFTLSGPSIVGGLLPLHLPKEIKTDRQRFFLPDEAVAFITSFETNSDPRRKNPHAVIDAFLKGVGELPQAHLIIRINNAHTESGEHTVLDKIRQRCAGHPRIRILSEALSYVDVLSLYASCDAYVSLHRAEGLGLGPMEAMALGKPVIATAWSGNMTFMNYTNACLVSYRLVPVDGSIDAYSKAFLGEGAYWAEPDVAEAAAWMRQLARDPSLRDRIGAKARDDMARFQAEAWCGRMLKELKAIWDSRSFLPPRTEQPTKPRQLQELLADRDRTISRLESELGWITTRTTYRLIKAMRNLLKGVSS